MRVLIDNCVPRRLGKEIIGHEVASVVKMGWADLDNGPLLDAMAGHFDVLITVDRSIPLQQRLADRPVALVVLRAKSNRLADLLPLVPDVLSLLETVGPGDVQEVGLAP